MLIQQRADTIGTFRWLQVTLMEMLAGWIATTPEMEVKVLFGRHVWDCAQHADALGKRAFEVRAPLHYTLTPLIAYKDFIENIGHRTLASERVAGFYDVLLPDLNVKYQQYLDKTDLLMDEPTVRIIKVIMADQHRMQLECDKLRKEVPSMQAVSSETDVTISDFVNYAQPSVKSAERIAT